MGDWKSNLRRLGATAPEPGPPRGIFVDAESEDGAKPLPTPAELLALTTEEFARAEARNLEVLSRLKRDIQEATRTFRDTGYSMPRWKLSAMERARDWHARFTHLFQSNYRLRRERNRAEPASASPLPRAPSRMTRGEGIEMALARNVEIERGGRARWLLRFGVFLCRLVAEDSADAKGKAAEFELEARRYLSATRITPAGEDLPPDDEGSATGPSDAHDEPDHELAAAQESCRKLAAEVERLTAANAELRVKSADAGLHAAFAEIAQIVLAEVTYARIMDRARDRTRRPAP